MRNRSYRLIKVCFKSKGTRFANDEKESRACNWMHLRTRFLSSRIKCLATCWPPKDPGSDVPIMFQF